MATPNDLYLLAVNLTRRCNLNCAHCYLDAETLKHGSSDELSTAEVTDLLDQVAERSRATMVVLTGGEPLLRQDLEELVAYGTALGLFMVVGTNGVMLKDKRVQSLKAAGAMGMGISVDSLDPEHHDQFRGRPGAWNKTLAGIEACRRHQLPFQVHFSVTERNAGEVPAMIDFARASGAHVLNFFFLVCTGRGESMSDISPAAYEQVLHQILAAQDSSEDLIIRARCAPHFQRVAHQRDPHSPWTRIQGYEGGSCIAGTHYCRITPEGGVTACPYVPDEIDNIRQRPFVDIWDTAPDFEKLRKPQLGGKCGNCEYQRMCGGCRARGLALHGDLMAEDSWCAYRPQGGAILEPFVETPATLSWTQEAEQRLSRIPAFLQKMVKRRAEAHVRGLGEREVNAEHLHSLARRRFGNDGPPRVIPKAPTIAAKIPIPEKKA